MFDTKHFVIRQLEMDGVVRAGDVKRAQEHAAGSNSDPLDALVGLGIVTSRRLAVCRARICEYPFVDLSAFDIDIRNAAMLPRAVADRLGAFPLFVLEGTATVAMRDPMNLQAIDQVRQVLKCDVDPVICDDEQLRALIARAYSLSSAGEAASRAEAKVEGDIASNDEPIVAAVNQILAGAAEAGASDVHINPDENDLLLRYRIDGVLQRQQGPTKSAHANIVQRLKVMARLDLTQTRRPQDGKFRFVHKGEAVDVRLSVLPTLHGENVVMRLLRSAKRIGTVSELGMPSRMLEWFQDIIHRPHGMVLVTGPTGSGKTTTLYAALSEINTPDVNIMTIEDPVEVRLPMIRQTQANAEIGLSFASVLRSVLRQDPDIVLVGEIRDGETAKIAVQAALTGHLVLSTLHTNEAIGAVARLKDMDVPGFAITNALLCVIAQRLVRKNCPDCLVDEDAGAVARVLGGVGVMGVKRGAGCARCGQTGYKGRAGVYEMLRVTARIQGLISGGAPEGEIASAARGEGMRTMWEDGVDKVKSGLTSLAEIDQLRTTLELGDASERSGDEMRAAA